MNETMPSPGLDVNHQAARPALSDRVRSLRLSDAPQANGGTSPWLPWVLCALLFLTTGYLALDAMTPVDEATLKQAVDERLALLAKDGNASATGAGTSAANHSGASADTEIALSSKGYVTPVHTIQVSPQVTGKILELMFDEGRNVKKGDVLARLETTEYQSYHDSARAKAASAEARWNMLWKYREDEIKQAKPEIQYLAYKNALNTALMNVSTKKRLPNDFDKEKFISTIQNIFNALTPQKYFIEVELNLNHIKKEY